MQDIKLSNGTFIPIEFHKARIVQKVQLLPLEERVSAMNNAGFNTFLLNSKDVFLDMLTDSGTNAMSDIQLSAMMLSDDAYAGSASFEKLVTVIQDVFGAEFVLPVHQGRAAEHIIAQTFVKKGDFVPMNYHFTTTRAHIELAGGTVLELFTDEALKLHSDIPFKGNMDLDKLRATIKKHGREKISFIRMEASTNLIGGQPFSLSNLREVKKIAQENGLLLVLDASLIGENAFFIHERETDCSNMSIRDILREMVSTADLTYFSGRKVSSTRGGAILTNIRELFMKMRDLVPLFEGFLTYGGMSMKEIEAMAVGLLETTDESVISQSPQFIRFVVNELDKFHIPVVTPAGALGVHIDAKTFLSHISQEEFPAGALATALFIVSGIRGMERGTISTDRDKETGAQILADVELLRLAVPRRVFTLSHMEFLIDRVKWLHENRNLIGGLRFVEEPPVLRFFTGRLEPTSNWVDKLSAKFQHDFGTSL